ncbi:MAG TPA: hypothetical protein VKG44_08300 [Candidatus Baltobacteraceae bacterium]|nr:hypothetical protein [Candidatus Baltobacteraceae bacterium]
MKGSPSQRFLFGILAAGALALLALGAASTASQIRADTAFRPQPAATTIVGTSSGPLFYVQNNGTTPAGTFGIIGAAGVGPLAIGVVGYGANAAAGNIGMLGYDIGPGGVAGGAYTPYIGSGPPSGANRTTGFVGIADYGEGISGQTYLANWGSSYGAAGVKGVDAANDNGYNDGVEGVTTNGAYGVVGLSSDGAFGGVAGVASTGTGVFAQSNSGFAVSASSAHGAVAINATTGAIGANAAAVFGSATASSPALGSGVVGKGYLGVVGQGRDASSFPLMAQDQNGASVFYVDTAGNVSYHGTLMSFARTRSGAVGRTYAPASTVRTIEDFGSGQIVNGSGVVQIDPTFGELGDGAYEVFLTPKGDSRGLYVSGETATSFVVRESQGGRSTLAFDYRIVAKQYGHSAERASLARSTRDFGEPPPRNPLANGANVPAKAFRLPKAATGLPNAMARFVHAH